MPESNIRLIITDVDGTLYGPHSRLSAGCREAISLALENGIDLTLASGRNKIQIDDLAQSLGLRLPQISLGGACVAYPHNPEPLRHVAIEVPIVEHIIAHARVLDMGVMLQTFNANLLESDHAVAREIERISHGHITRVADLHKHPIEGISKITLIGRFQATLQTQTMLRDTYAGLHAVLSGERYLDITAPSADKGSAVRFLLEHLDLRRVDLAVIGDGHNDLSMFAEAGLSVAMGNALQDVKVRADRIAPSNAEDGAAWAINAIIADNH